MKRIISAFATVTVALIADRSAANTLAWFHFDEQAPGYVFESVGPCVVTNECNAATPVYTYATTGITMDATPSAYMPRYSTPAYGTRLYDPVSGRTWRNHASMRFTTGTESGKGGSYYGGTLKVPGTDKSFQPADAITIECFVCTTGGTFNTFAPIFGKRNSGDYSNESWALYMTSNGKLEVRIKAKYSGTTGQGVAINDGNWHHVAMTYDKADGVCHVYVDYEESFPFSPSGGGAISYLNSPTEAYTAFHVGGYPYVSSNNAGRKFDGCIDELRISDVALQPAQFLRMAPEADDELVRLSLDPHSFYGSTVNSSVNYNFRPDIAAAFTFVGGAVSFDAAEKYAAMVRDGIFADAVANLGSYSAVTNSSGQSGYFKVTALTTKMSGGNVETNIDYTIEASFKARTTNKAYGPRTLFTLGTWPVAGAVLNNKADSGQLCFTFNDGKSWKGVYSDATTANDGSWHHVAVVCDTVRKQMRFYFDGRLSAKANNVNNVLQTGSSLFVGSNTSGGYGFDGWIDDVRVMNRALSPDEFLCTHDVGNVDASNPTVALMDFENSYATTPYPGLVGTGAGDAHSSAGAAPEFVGCDRTYLTDGTNGTEEVAGTACLRFADSQAYWPYSPLFEQESFTVEFFGKFFDLVSGAGIVRYAGGVANPADTPVWAIYRDPSKDDLCLRIQLVKDGVSDGNYDAHWLSDAEMKDNRWHHYALTLQPKDGTNTIVELFRDYASVGAHELEGRLDYTIGNGGRLALGAGSSGNKVYGSYDMLRFSKGVLTPDKFIGKRYFGTMFILR